MLSPLKSATDKEHADGRTPDLETLFREHHDRVFRAAYRITGNIMDAEDVVQTVFLRLARRDRTSPLPDYPGSYLHLAAINGALDLVRARGAAKSAPIEEAETHTGPRAVGGPERDQADREIREKVRQGLTRLSPRTAEAFALRYFEGYTNQEIAGMLETSTSVIAVLLHRARQRLKIEIAPLIGGMS